MNKTRVCLVGHDDDDGGLAGWLIALIIIVAVIMVMVMIMAFAGVFIGGFHSLKNYFASFGSNVIASNRRG